MQHCLKLIIAFLCLVSSACATHLCELDRRPPLVPPGLSPEELPTAYWMMLLLRGPSHTCVGEAIVSAVAEQEKFTLRPQPSHTMAPLKGWAGQYVVWLQTHRAGDLLYGPVALVRRTSQGFAVMALGSLSARDKVPSFSLASTAMGRVLWVRSQGCTHHKALSRPLCFEELLALPLVNDRLVGLAQAPRIDVLRQEALPLKHGWFRLVEYRQQCDVNEGGLMLLETLCSQDLSSRTPKLVPRNRREVQTRRTVSFSPQHGWAAKSPERPLPGLR